MKMTNYKLQIQMEQITPSSTEWFENYIKEILESDKPYYVKADYIGLSFQELQNKIDYIANDIKELQSLKKKLTQSKAIAQEVTAEVLANYGVDRIDGSIISSITLTKPSIKTRDIIKVIDEHELMKMGYVKFELDLESIQKALKTEEGLKELSGVVSISSDKVTTPAKVKVNTKRSSANTMVDDILSIEQQKAA